VVPRTLGCTRPSLAASRASASREKVLDLSVETHSDCVQPDALRGSDGHEHSDGSGAFDAEGASQ